MDLDYMYGQNIPMVSFMKQRDIWQGLDNFVIPFSGHNFPIVGKTNFPLCNFNVVSIVP